MKKDNLRISEGQLEWILKEMEESCAKELQSFLKSLVNYDMAVTIKKKKESFIPHPVSQLSF